MVSAELIDKAIQDAVDGKSNLTDEQLKVRGFSTPTMRHLFNNICNIEGTYLEVGLYCGGTFVSSFNKDLISIGVENYAQDFSVSTVKEELEDNILRNSERAKEVKLIIGDCFNLEKDALPKNIDILFWDGEHSYDNQKKAIPYFLDNMADKFLVIIDDVSWPVVAEGTTAGLESIADKITIENQWLLKGDKSNDDPIWHNSVFIALISKK